MKKRFFNSPIIGILAVFCLAGCETVQSWFPDKQKQYRYSSEIPPLEVPPDLSSSTLEGAVSHRNVSTEHTSRPNNTPSPIPTEKSIAEEPSVTPRKTESHTDTPSTLAQTQSDVPLIEMEAPFEIAWVEIAKALGRMELEITDQNRSEGTYYVYYGGDKKPHEENGFLSEVGEFFGGGSESAKEYHVKLESRHKTTSVYILNADNEPQKGGPGLDLLKRLHDTLQKMAKSQHSELSGSE